MPSKSQQSRPLQRLFEKQQSKVKAKKTVGRLLTQLAEQDHKRIARLIQQWLDEEKT